MGKMLERKVSWTFLKFGLKIGIYSHLNEYMKTCEYKRSRYFFDL